MELVEFLYAVLFYYLEGNKKNKELEKLLTNLDKSRKWSLEIAGLAEAGKAIKAGKPVDLELLVFGLKSFLAEYKKTSDAKLGFAKILNAFLSYFRSQSATAYKYLETASSKAASPYIRQFMAKSDSERIDQALVKKKLARLVKQLGGKGYALSVEEGKIAKEANEDLYKEYLKERRMFTQAFKDFVSSYVRNSGSTKVASDQVIRALKEAGVEHFWPEGFTGLIDAEGHWYTKEGKLINGVPAKTQFPSVVMNTTGQGDWVFQAIRTDGTPGNYFYTKEAKNQNALDKFAFTREFTKNVPKYRKKWLSLIRPDLNPESMQEVAAIVIELLYESSHRIGTTIGGNEGGAGFGLSSILVKHVTIRPDDSILISYKGKDAVQFKLELKPNTSPLYKNICKIIAELIEGKGPRDPVFTYQLKNGTYKPVQPAYISRLFGQITNGANIHKLRTYWGSKIFNDEVAKYYEKLKRVDAKKALELLKLVATKVGKRLGHVSRNAKTGETKVNPATSLQNYIDVESQISFFKHWGLPPPPYLDKMLEQDKTIKASTDPEDKAITVDDPDLLSHESEVLNLESVTLLTNYLNGWAQEYPTDTL